uniref:Uncharacterized protein n=1 Tax=Asparagus officinalis TaxID=4686 RepID=Q2AAB1_ASPOF|nr:hypothetical protein 17.t00015 [Asparagus officinalis]
MHYLMKKIGYDFTRKEGLNFGKGRKIPIKHVYVPEGKPEDYYHKTHRGLGYESPPLIWCFEATEESEGSFTNSSSESNYWDSDVSTGAVFKELMINMTSAQPIETQEDNQLPLFEDLLSRQLGIQ